MPTILALDELLAHAVGPKLPGMVEVCGRMRMREEGDDIVKSLALQPGSVLAIGAASWNPLPLLAEWKLPARVPVVVLVPEVTEEVARMAAECRVFSVIPADGSLSGMSKCVVNECVLANASLRRGRKEISPVLVVPSRRPRCACPESRVLAFPRQMEG